MESLNVKNQVWLRDEEIINNRVFVGGLAHETSENELDVFFSEYGEVNNVRIVYDRKTGKNKGYGFVTFNKQESSAQLIDMDTVLYKGRKLRIRQAVRKNSTPNGLEKMSNSGEGQWILVPLSQPENIQVTPQIMTCGYPEYYSYTLQPFVQQPQYVYPSHPAAYGHVVYY